MTKITIDLDQFEDEFLKFRLEKLIQAAYEKGVEDGIKRFSYPPVLKNSHLAEILQVKMTTVYKITQNPAFPKMQNIKGRYPRDKVFEWIDRNSK
ncbi:hypothetical protein [Metabacillus fastidiosus]|uniref:hypothetical protein n=1 Tax=Metabacillus fastidiosus TaxID=1458 RepID=UPI002E1C97C1|nr:hypothetical protein [Metabacillus fastidiosus]